jgi:uncharacterized protein YbjQ (UPF0145 family)
MSIFAWFRKPSAEAAALEAAHVARQAELLTYIQGGALPPVIEKRLQEARAGTLPWIATLTPAELLIARSHGVRPIATVSATCWLHYGWSWTLGHSEGWTQALHRLKDEARAAGANAVLDVKMRTVSLGVADSMDFTLVGTAVYVEDLEPSGDPVVATVPALEFVKLLEGDVVPTGIAVGAHYQWIADWRNSARMTWMGNVESPQFSQLWATVRDRAHQDLRANARSLGNGVLAHVNFSQSFEREDQNHVKQYLARHIVVATTVDARPGAPMPHGVKMVVDLHAGKSPLTGTTRHNQSYLSNESEGAI